MTELIDMFSFHTYKRMPPVADAASGNVFIGYQAERGGNW